MSKGWLYDWEGMATMGRQDLDTRFGRKLACSLSMFARDWRAPAPLVEFSQSAHYSSGIPRLRKS
jgi:hypothetical protein